MINFVNFYQNGNDISNNSDLTITDIQPSFFNFAQRDNFLGSFIQFSATVSSQFNITNVQLLKNEVILHQWDLLIHPLQNIFQYKYEYNGVVGSYEFSYKVLYTKNGIEYIHHQILPVINITNVGEKFLYYDYRDLVEYTKIFPFNYGTINAVQSGIKIPFIISTNVNTILLNISVSKYFNDILQDSNFNIYYNSENKEKFEVFSLELEDNSQFYPGIYKYTFVINEKITKTISFTVIPHSNTTPIINVISNDVVFGVYDDIEIQVEDTVMINYLQCWKKIYNMIDDVWNWVLMETKYNFTSQDIQVFIFLNPIKEKYTQIYKFIAMDDNGNSTIQEVPINYIKSRIEMISPLSNDTLDFNVNNNFICKIISYEPYVYFNFEKWISGKWVDVNGRYIELYMDVNSYYTLTLQDNNATNTTENYRYVIYEPNSTNYYVKQFTINYRDTGAILDISNIPSTVEVDKEFSFNFTVSDINNDIISIYLGGNANVFYPVGSLSVFSDTLYRIGKYIYYIRVNTIYESLTHNFTIEAQYPSDFIYPTLNLDDNNVLTIDIGDSTKGRLMILATFIKDDVVNIVNNKVMNFENITNNIVIDLNVLFNGSQNYTFLIKFEDQYGYETYYDVTDQLIDKNYKNLFNDITITNSDVVFDIPQGYVVGANELEIYLNGIMLNQNEYIELDSFHVQLLNIPPIGSNLLLQVTKGSGIIFNKIISGDFTQNGNEITLAHNYVVDSNNLKVFLNGILLRKGILNDYIENTANTITMNYSIGSNVLTYEILDFNINAFEIMQEEITVNNTGIITTIIPFKKDEYNLKIYLNGLLMRVGINEDYVELDNNTFQFNYPLINGNILFYEIINW